MDHQRFYEVAREYIASNDPAVKETLIKSLNKNIGGLMKAVIEPLKSAIAAGGEEALLDNPIDELLQAVLAREIKTPEDRDRLLRIIPEFLQIVRANISGLDIVCVSQAITKGSKSPTYKKATSLALKEAEKLIEKICKETSCNVDTARMIAKELLQNTSYMTHCLFYPKEHKAYDDQIDKAADQITEIMMKITKPVTDKKNDQYYKERDRLVKEMDDNALAFMNSMYKYDKLERIAADIISRIFPDQSFLPATISQTDKLYFTLPSTSLTKLTKQILNNPTRIKTTRRGQIKRAKLLLTGDSTITYKGNDSTVTLTLERTKELFAKKIQNGAKVFNFFLQKLNEQNRYELTKFQLAELVENGAYANKDSAYRGLKNILNKIYAISIEGIATEYNGRKKQEKAFAKSRMISSFNVTYNDCFVSLTPIIRENIPYITLLPSWSYKLNENSYMLLDYIFYLARQNAEEIRRTGYFNIGLETIRAHMGLLTPEDAGSDPKRLIFEPIDNAITEIEEKQKGTEIKITPSYYAEYENIQSYLAGYLRIELDQPAQTYMIERAIAQEKEYIEEQKRIEKAKQRAADKAIKQA